MDLETKNWLWLEQVAEQAAKTHHRSALEYARDFHAQNEKLTQQEIDTNVRAIITDPNRYILLPQMMPGSEEIKQLYEGLISQYKMNTELIKSFENEYINEDTSDPHVMKSLLKFIDILDSKNGIDPYMQSTHMGSFGEFLVILDAGSGHELSKVMQIINHNFLIVAVPNLRYLVTSFKVIDWLEIWNQYCMDDNKAISLFIFDGTHNSPEGLIGALANHSTPGLDHSFIFYPNENDKSVQELKDKALSMDRTHVPINYLGFAMDEYNMMWHSWHSMLEEPRIFKSPTKKIDYPVIVVGSGPSLDENIEYIRQLQDTHIVVAAASSSYALLDQGIEPDFLILLERGTHEVDNYTKLKKDFPHTQTKLVASVSCSHKLHSLFDDSAIYFRPGSTPSTLFCPSPLNVIEFEGPQTVNTAVSFALRISSGDVILAGIDLGTTSLKNPRSKGAVGISPRNFDLKEKGNFCDFVYTERELLDGALMMGDCIQRYSGESSVFNASNGLYIRNTTPKSFSEYISSLPSNMPTDKIQPINHFWSELTFYRRSDLMSRWNACSPRKQTLEECNKLHSIFDLPAQEWFEFGCQKLTKILSIEKYMRNQFVSKLYRGAVLKSSLAIRRQMNILKDRQDDRDEFYAESAIYMKSLISNMRNEVFKMCDELECNYFKKVS